MDAVVVMAKAPIAKEVKTRLVPPLDPEMASKLYKSFLLDKIEQVENISGIRHFVAYTPASSESYFRSIVPKEFTLINQVGSDLGERLINISSIIFNQGFKKVVLSDSDTPNLPSEMIVEAFRRLDSYDVVLGPCEDGGYYLIGLRSNMPELFREIPWSTSGVLKSTIRKVMEMHATVTLLDEWYDVDTVESLSRLKRDLESKPQIGFFCRNSYQTLSKINLQMCSRQTLQTTLSSRSQGKMHIMSLNLGLRNFSSNMSAVISLVLTHNTESLKNGTQGWIRQLANFG